jgi:hypothetical protein
VNHESGDSPKDISKILCSTLEVKKKNEKERKHVLKRARKKLQGMCSGIRLFLPRLILKGYIQSVGDLIPSPKLGPLGPAQFSFFTYL